MMKKLKLFIVAVITFIPLVLLFEVLSNIDMENATEVEVNLDITSQNMVLDSIKKNTNQTHEISDVNNTTGLSLYDLIDENGNHTPTKPTPIDKSNPGYSDEVRLPSTQHTTTPSFNERKEYGINTSDTYTSYEYAIKEAKKQERLDVLYKVLSAIFIISLITISYKFIRNLLAE
ncbi:MAG: hypothetical protein K1X33_09120 [Methanobacteriaceae archaeon]|nr:hypothetical protein [Methanobacteriaceae archaeon]